jgi:serine/threonine protein kinase
MSGHSSIINLTSNQTSQVLDILERYLSDLEQGKRVSPEELAARHPEIADVLRGYFKKLNTLHHAAAGLVDASRPQDFLPSSALTERGRLGDFHILREIGRGGMGIVYEAEQISLARRVALKVLPFATALNARQLRRFQNEAQAAAHLHHTNIVPVHAVGSDRGVHYYAMQFIEGQTVAKMIEELRSLTGRSTNPADPSSIDVDGRPGEDVTTQPHYGVKAWRFDTPTPPPAASDTRNGPATVATKKSSRDPSLFQTVARLGVQAAEALEHAHQMGVVHRDIKPANLLVNDRGHLWITDFGLARCQGEGGLTLTGDVLGTLRYMSPEQALAKRMRVTHHTDIYSLGVTLYEMLTLEPAYNGRDRQEILKQIAFDDPRPPRKVNSAIPIELETIVLKAMAKEPESRYATAQEMADDLRRFLEQRPILAKRPTWREHLRKWTLRHKQLVLASAGLIFTSALACSLLLWNKQKNLEEALKQVGIEHAQSEKRAKQAQDNFERAEYARAHSQKNFARLSEGILQMLRQVENTRWTGVERIDDVRQAMAEELVGIFKDYLSEESTDPEARLEAGWAYLFMANVNRVRGADGQAVKGYHKAIELFSSLVQEFPFVSKYRGELGCAYFALGSHLASGGSKTPDAEEAYRKAAENYQMASCCSPEALNNYAWLLAICPFERYRNPKAAVELAEKAVGMNPTAGVFWNTLGVAQYRAGKWQKAIDALEQSRKLRRGGDGFDYFFLAMAYWQKKDKDKAREWFNKGEENMENTNVYTEPVRPYQQEAAILLGVKCRQPTARRPAKPTGHASNAVDRARAAS